MKTIKAGVILLIASIGFSSVAFAQQSDRATYRAAKKQADATYKAAKAQCDTMKGTSSGAEKEDCIGIAKAEQKLAKAQAEAAYKSTDKNHMNVSLAAAEVDYTKAKAKCDAMPGNVKETGAEKGVCMSKAAEARNQAIASAKAGKKAAEEGVPKKPGSSMDTRGDIGKK